MRRLLLTLIIVLPLLAIGIGVAALAPPLSDDFNNAATLSDWSEGPVSTYDLMDINTSQSGQLVIVPTNLLHNAWYAGNYGPYRYKLVSGDFIATTYVTAGNVNNHSAPPTGSYNAAGFVIRDPSSGAGDEDWVMFNLGNQAAGLATEAKTTIDSTSVLTLTAAATNAGRLSVCRSGDTFYMYRWLDGESGWSTQEVIIRPDLPTTMQVGPIAHGWTNADLYAQFDYVHIITGSFGTSAACANMLGIVPTAVTVSSTSTTPNSHPTLIVAVVLAVLLLPTTVFFVQQQSKQAQDDN